MCPKLNQQHDNNQLMQCVKTAKAHAKTHGEQNNTILKEARTCDLEFSKHYEGLMVTHSGEAGADLSVASQMSEERKSENIFFRSVLL